MGVSCCSWAGSMWDNTSIRSVPTRRMSINGFAVDVRLTVRLRSLKNTIDAQFLRSREKLASSGPAQHLMYSSGRRNALGLHTTIMLYPIHDIFSLFLSFGKSLIEPTAEFGESIVFNLTLGKGDEGKQGESIGVWAVTEKSQMRLREKRWDLVSCLQPVRGI